MEDGFHLNVAIVTPARAWNWTHIAPLYVTTHFCAVYCGRDRENALFIAREFAARFPQGDEPSRFKLSMTEWQSRGTGVEL
jgi:hypothetical protein